MDKYYDGYGLIWDGIFTRPVKKIHSFSFCITCMNRLYNLKETLPVNLKLEESYPFIEFVVLDYNSKDGLGDWMKINMMEHIESGRISYYRTEEPKYFSMCHSRNIAFKIAKGEIVLNLDADNYTARNGGSPPEEPHSYYLNRLANQVDGNKVIFAKGKKSIHGRVGFYKNNFINDLGGYDENLLGYGHDDHDLIKRAWGLGYSMYWWGGQQYFGRIATVRSERNANMERNWKITEKENIIKSDKNIANKIFKANRNNHWGQATLLKNFTTFINV
jgi:glycosyltransferase involved in cell wall biosynthesis